MPHDPADLTADHPDVAALGPAGRALVLDLVEELDADDLELDTKERTLLLEAARHLDIAARIERTLAEGDLMVIGSQNQPRPNPLLDTLDKTRRTTAQLLSHVAKGNRDEQARHAAKARARGVPTSARIGA